MSDRDMAYLGLDRRGAPVAVVRDMAGYEQETARDISKLISNGYVVERMALNEAVRVYGQALENRPPE